MHFLRKLLFALLIFIGFLLTLWATAALYFDVRIASLQVPLAVLYLVLMLGAFFFLRRPAAWWFSSSVSPLLPCGGSR